jgi:hypothetical protein
MSRNGEVMGPRPGRVKDPAAFASSRHALLAEPAKWAKARRARAIPHFMGYRFGLFNYATKHPGGYADFDWFRIKYKD